VLSVCSTTALLFLSWLPLLTSPFLTVGRQSPVRAKAEPRWLPSPRLLPIGRAHRRCTTSALSPEWPVQPPSREGEHRAGAGCHCAAIQRRPRWPWAAPGTVRDGQPRILAHVGLDPCLISIFYSNCCKLYNLCIFEFNSENFETNSFG
jgi:hypothetical protein